MKSKLIICISFGLILLAQLAWIIDNSYTLAGTMTISGAALLAIADSNKNNDK